MDLFCSNSIAVSITDVTCQMLGLLAGDRVKEDWLLNRPHYSADGTLPRTKPSLTILVILIKKNKIH
jgi:hypothetical protein